MYSDLLHVVAVFSNPRRYASRERLARAFISHMLASGVCLTMVEHAFGERPFVFAPSDAGAQGWSLVQVRGGANQELWIKEALQKIGVRTLPNDWRYLALIDADITFTRADWAAETVQMLQHHRVGQNWSHSVDLGPNGEVLRNEWGNDADRSFSAAWLAGDVSGPVEGYGVGQPQSRALLANKGARDWRQHYGYAWAFRREAWDGIGGLPDWLVTGSADYHAALAFAGKLDRSEAYVSPGATRRLREFADRCDAFVRQDIGCVPGTILHGFHGSKRNRVYLTRKDILVESQFDPDKDLTHDWQGIPSLAGDNRLLRDGLRRLMVIRNEDSTSI
jgi:hypothetical protein